MLEYRSERGGDAQGSKTKTLHRRGAGRSADHLVRLCETIGVLARRPGRDDEAVVVEKTTSLFANAQQIEHGGSTWLMKPARYFGKTFNVASASGTVIGTIAPARFFFPLSDITVDLPDDVPLLVQVFMLWLAVRYWATDSSGGT